MYIYVNGYNKSYVEKNFIYLGSNLIIEIIL